MVNLVAVKLVAITQFLETWTRVGFTFPERVPVLGPQVLSELIVMCWVQILVPLSLSD